MSITALSDLERRNLRDQFAGQALQGLIASYAGHNGDPMDPRFQKANAERCYQQADAMLHARGDGPAIKAFDLRAALHAIAKETFRVTAHCSPIPLFAPDFDAIVSHVMTERGLK